MNMNEELLDKRFLVLVKSGLITREELRTAEGAAMARGVELERILAREHRIPRRELLTALSEYYGCPFAEYDERMPIPPELLAGLDGERLSMSQWFPIIKDGATVVIAANNPEDPTVLEEIKKYICADVFEFRVALGEDIQWYIQDFLHAEPGYLIGTERTGLAFWRNTMAQWRTRLACYRNDLAKGRTDLAFLRWGLGFLALSNSLMRSERSASLHQAYWVMTASGISLSVFG